MLLVRKADHKLFRLNDLLVSKFTNHRSLVTFWSSTSKTRSPQPFPTQRKNNGILAKARNALQNVITR